MKPNSKRNGKEGLCILACSVLHYYLPLPLCVAPGEGHQCDANGEEGVDAALQLVPQLPPAPLHQGQVNLGTAHRRVQEAVLVTFV